MLAIDAEIPVRPDERERMLELASDVAEKSRSEEGIIDYRVTIDVDDPNLIRFMERYEDEATFDDHMEAEHTQELMAMLPDLVTEEVKAYRLEVESRTELQM